MWLSDGGDADWAHRSPRGSRSSKVTELLASEQWTKALCHRNQRDFTGVRLRCELRSSLSRDWGRLEASSSNV